MANITQINVNGTTYDLKDNISGYTTAYDGTTTSDTKYDALFLETLASGVDTVKVGLDMDLLWTNSSPTSSFSTQTVSIDLSGYSMVVISCYIANSVNTELFYNIGIVGTSIQMQPPIYNGTLRSRTASITTSGVTFGSGIFWNTYNNASSAQTQDVQCIPYKIYGIR